jgi:hypothetical protein
MISARSGVLLGIVASFICLGFADGSNDSQSRLEKIATGYRSFREHRQYDTARTADGVYKWTQPLCVKLTKSDIEQRMQNNGLHLSGADPDMSPHGNKLYRLYVKDYDAYWEQQTEQPLGQALVKETWNVREIAYDKTNTTIPQMRSGNDGKWYTPTTVSQLFVMYKEAESPDNDKGWVYGIIDLEKGKESPIVLYKGRISSCISCHKDTKYDRMFGVQ